MTVSKPTLDRRRHGRAQIRFEAILEGEQSGEQTRLQVLNFSVGGFFCLSSRSFELMTRLGIRFHFPPYEDEPAREIEGEAVVVRCTVPQRPGDGWRVGACFTSLGSEARDHIEGYVDWYHRSTEAAEAR